MPRLSFTLSDVFWLTLVVGLALGWSLERRRLIDDRDANVTYKWRWEKQLYSQNQILRAAREKGWKFIGVGKANHNVEMVLLDDSGEPIGPR